MPSQCPRCKKVVYAAEERVAGGYKFHNVCFKCCKPCCQKQFSSEHVSDQKEKMPFKPIEVSKCPKCSKSVYAAEEMVAGGYKWHKFCFKCSMCNKLLDSMTVAEHQAELYCKQCHGRKYGPKGVGFGIGAGALTMDTGEQFGNKTVEMTNRPLTGEAFTAPVQANHR